MADINDFTKSISQDKGFQEYLKNNQFKKIPMSDKLDSVTKKITTEGLSNFGDNLAYQTLAGGVGLGQLGVGALQGANWLGSKLAPSYTQGLYDKTGQTLSNWQNSLGSTQDKLWDKIIKKNRTHNDQFTSDFAKNSAIWGQAFTQLAGALIPDIIEAGVGAALPAVSKASKVISKADNVSVPKTAINVNPSGSVWMNGNTNYLDDMGTWFDDIISNPEKAIDNINQAAKEGIILPSEATNSKQIINNAFNTIDNTASGLVDAYIGTSRNLDDTASALYNQARNAEQLGNTMLANTYYDAANEAVNRMGLGFNINNYVDNTTTLYNSATDNILEYYKNNNLGRKRVDIWNDMIKDSETLRSFGSTEEADNVLAAANKYLDEMNPSLRAEALGTKSIKPGSTKAITNTRLSEIEDAMELPRGYYKGDLALAEQEFKEFNDALPFPYANSKSAVNAVKTNPYSDAKMYFREYYHENPNELLNTWADYTPAEQLKQLEKLHDTAWLDDATYTTLKNSMSPTKSTTVMTKPGVNKLKQALETINNTYAADELTDISTVPGAQKKFIEDLLEQFNTTKGQAIKSSDIKKLKDWGFITQDDINLVPINKK